MYLNILESSTKLGIDNRKLTLEEMVSKLQEEVTELKEAIKNKDNIEHISEESWDCFQLSAEVLDKLEDQHNVNLEESLNKHHKKLRERGWKAKKMLVFEVKIRNSTKGVGVNV
ncbi:MazG nucleotide pyrophosphohydrolase domain-containing protein [Clostridium botulinum]|uniref:MazG nucleotide pyrophosphohydrolase domain-containing protein n=1 Tax=Clostridium botulinum TaxID=1491 RepID=UPI000773397B|nr:MazG nucleotide pyrophosphohydrolase domain-containing protein [Clostridium botulinum]